MTVELWMKSYQARVEQLDQGICDLERIVAGKKALAHHGPAWHWPLGGQTKNSLL